MSHGVQHSINEVIGEVTRALIPTTTTKNEIRQRSCEQFSTLELYSFAWIGRYNSDKEEVVPTASAGIAENTLTGITITEESPRAELTTEAVRTREVTVGQNLVDDPPCEEWRDHALNHDYQACAAIPLVYEETLSGVLHLATNRPQGFGAAERESLAELGVTIAYAFEHAEPPANTDPTERKEAEEEMTRVPAEPEQERRLYETIISSTPDLVYAFDLDYRFIFANDALLEMWGQTYEESIGKTLLEIGYEPWHAEMHEREIDQVVETKEPIRGEVAFEHAELGRRIYDYIFAPVLNDEGGVEAIAGTTRDITERKEAEEALQESKERFRALVNASSDVVYRMSPDWSEMYHLKGQEFIADTDEPTSNWLEKYIHPDDRERVMEAIDEAIQTKSIFELEHRIKQVDGSLGWTLSRAVPRLDEDGDIVEWVGMASDITERKRRERRYRTLVENFPNGAVTLYDEDLRYITVGGENISQMGLTVEEIEGSLLQDVVPDSLAEQMAPHYRAAVEEGERRTFEAEYDDRYFQFRALPVRDDDGTVFAGLGMSQEITERKEYERDLEQYKTLAETASEVIVLIDEQSQIQSVNPAVEEIFGYEPDELVGEPLTTLMPESMRERHQDSIQQYLQTGERTLNWDYIELSGLHKEGHEVPLAISFSEFEQDGDRFFTGIIRDNTERKELEDELRQERDLRERIFETSPTGILVIDPDGTIPFVNTEAADLLGVPEDKMSDIESLFSTIEVTTPEGTQAEGELFREILATGDPVSGIKRQITHPDGQQLWISINGTPLCDSSGEVTAIVFTLSDITELKRYQDQLISLNELSQNLMDAETEQAVSELVVETARETLPLPLGVVALYDETQGQLRYTAQTSGVSELVRDGQLFEAELGLPWQVFTDQAPAVYENLHSQAELSELDTSLQSVMIFPLGEHGVFISGATTADAFSETDESIAQMLVANTRSALDRVAREQTLRERTDTLAEQNAALERLQRVNEIIRNITTELIQAPTREEIVQAVCDRLADADAYRFAWIGTHDSVTDTVEPEAWAGVEDGYLETVTATADGGEHRHGPTGRAVRSTEAQVENNLAVDPPFDVWQQVALDRGYQASIAVPLIYQDTLYGVLTLYAGQPGVFNQMEETVLRELGEIIGYALNALERKRALVSEKSVELEFRLRGGKSPISQFAAKHDCECEFENLIQPAEGLPQVFFTVRGVPPDEVLQFAEQDPNLEDLTLVHEQDNAALFESRLRDSSFLSTLLDHGAMLQSLMTTGDEEYAVIRVPESSNVRTFVELYEAQFEEVELVGRRKVDEAVRTQQEFETKFRTQLTERQEEILKTAYESGFFDSPRKMTAQDLAEMLDVSQPTVSRHIRAGERKLFGLVFDEE